MAMTSGPMLPTTAFAVDALRINDMNPSVSWRGAESQYVGRLESTRSKATENAYIGERQEGCERYKRGSEGTGSLGHGKYVTGLVSRFRVDNVPADTLEL